MLNIYLHLEAGFQFIEKVDYISYDGSKPDRTLATANMGTGITDLTALEDDELLGEPVSIYANNAFSRYFMFGGIEDHTDLILDPPNTDIEKVRARAKKS
jgi:hypothetical protein